MPGRSVCIIDGKPSNCMALYALFVSCVQGSGKPENPVPGSCGGDMRHIGVLDVVNVAASGRSFHAEVCRLRQASLLALLHLLHTQISAHM